MNVLISQRVDVLPQRGERRDALDQAWGSTLSDLLGTSVLMLPVPNRPQDVDAMVAACRPSLIVLSGGNDIGGASERDVTETRLLDGARASGVPVLAVCRGMQMMQVYLGGVLAPVVGHVRCDHPVHAAPGHALPTLTVNSYHDWGIRQSELAADLCSLYLHEDGTVEAAAHASCPWLGVMWHPERAGSGMVQANDWVARWLREKL
jgi:N5-(cytidine 5'-diphosphoramidyl)-L-glutamine hydrolase